MSDYFSILTNLGYRLQNNVGGYWRCSPLYRDSDSNSIAISSKDGHLVDFAHPENSGSFKKLISLTLGLPIHKVGDYLKSKKYKELDNSKEEIDLSSTYPNIFQINEFGPLIPDHSYWIKRGIPQNIIQYLKGGIIRQKESRLANRYVLPIFARDGQTINGFAGRALFDIKKGMGAKWKCLGAKKFWEYPLFLTEKYIKQEKEIICVESAGDFLALAKMGIKNVIAPIGISSFERISLLCLEFDPDKIIIAFNNDHQSNAGNKAAHNLQKCLSNFFNKEKIKIRLPQETNDLGDCSEEQLKKYIQYAKN